MSPAGTTQPQLRASAGIGLEGLGFDVAAHVSPGLRRSVDEMGLRLGASFLVNRLS
jgi:hypothetical protein